MTWSDFSWRFACGDVLPYHRLQDVSYAAHGASGLRRVAFFGTGCNENLRLEHWVFRRLVINLGTDLSLNRLIQVLLWHLVLGGNCHLQIGSAMLGFAHFDRCFSPPTLTWQSVLIFPNLHYFRKTSNGSRVSLWHLPWQYLDLKVSENKKNHNHTRDKCPLSPVQSKILCKSWYFVHLGLLTQKCCRPAHSCWLRTGSAPVENTITI